MHTILTYSNYLTRALQQLLLVWAGHLFILHCKNDFFIIGLFSFNVV